MKRLVLMMALVITLSLVACGGDKGHNTAPASNPEASVPAALDVTLVSKEANFTTLLVPSDFGDFYDKDGYAVAEGTNSSIVVTPTVVPDVRIEDITEDYMVDLMGETYSNIRVLAFNNPATIAGVDAISFQCTGDGATSGKNKTICHLTLFFSIEGQDCEQQLIFTYDTGASTSLEAYLTDIIESISLE
jgi:hypothetical protein